MKAKWYFSVIIIFLTLLGIHQEQTTVPNQEIVLQFVDDEVTNEEAQNAIVIIKEQLQAIGINNIQVGEQENGKLKIIYYSDANVESIKRILSKGKKIEIGYTSFNKDDTDFPSDKNQNEYEFDVYEIQSADTSFDFDGKYALELKQEYDRFSNPNIYTFAAVVNISEKCRIVKTACKIHKSITFFTGNTLHNIPEVRAGPSC